MKLEKFGALAASPGRNVFLVGVIRACAVAGAAIIPALPEFLEPLGVSVWSVEICFAAVLLAAMLPTGVLADRFGSKGVILIGAANLVLAEFVYVTAGSKYAALLAEAMLGFGLSCIFGAEESLLHRSLHRMNSQGLFHKVWGRIVALETFAAAAHFYVGDWLSHIAPSYPFYYAAAVYSIVLIAGLLLQDESGAESYGHEPTRHRPSLGTFAQAVRLGLFGPAEIRLPILWYALFGGLIGGGFWSYSAYLAESQSVAPRGLVFAVCCITGGLSSALTAKWRHLFSRQSAVVRGLLIMSAAYLLLGHCIGGWSFVLLLVPSAIRASSRVLFSYYLQNAVTEHAEHLRATITSLREAVFLTGYIATLTIGSQIAEARGASAVLATIGYTAGAIVFAVTLSRLRVRNSQMLTERSINTEV